MSGLVKGLLLGAVYFAAGKFGLSLAFVHSSATAVWPPTGIAIASLLLLGPRFWPAIFLGAFAVNLSTSGAVGASLGIALGNTLEGLAGAAIAERYAGGRKAFDSSGNFFRFIFLAAMLSPVLSASIGTASLWLGGLAAASTLRHIWTTWWLGDASGAVLVAPLIILWAVEPGRRWRPAKIAEAAALAATVALLGWMVFWAPPFHSLAYWCVPVLVWTAFRFGRRETATLLCVILGMALWATIHGHGPFYAESPHQSLLRLQLFMGVMAATKLALAILVWGSREAEKNLQKAHDELEARVRQRTEALSQKTAELERSNEDLSEFAAVASHDLQEPLHKIANFIELFQQKYRGKTDEEGDQIIGYVVNGAARMERLIRDLLNYTRLGQAGLPLEQIDMNESLRQAASSVEAAMVESGARLTNDPLPSVLANDTQMAQLWQNLLANAIKFRGEEPPRIHVSARRDGRDWTFSVTDNGIGIDPKYSERIFGIFQRLHSRSKYAGTGIGLALCRKIVERHRGRIWVESSLGRGSTFYFTLPAAS